MHTTTKRLLTPIFKPFLSRPSSLPPPFLIPSITQPQTTPFSSTPIPSIRRTGDRNHNRGISALRHSGLRKRQKLSVKLAHLPQPVLDPRKRSAVHVDEDHGLWDFFPRERACMATPAELQAHGRGWTVPELRGKDWEDLWRLWWVCVKERNRLVTGQKERERLGEMDGETETEERVKEVRRTQKAIRHVLTERWYAWENARFAAMEDPEVNLYADPDKGDVAYIPMPDVEEDSGDLALEEASFEADAEGKIPPPATDAKSPPMSSEARI